MTTYGDEIKGSESPFDGKRWRIEYKLNMSLLFQKLASSLNAHNELEGGENQKTIIEHLVAKLLYEVTLSRRKCKDAKWINPL